MEDPIAIDPSCIHRICLSRLKYIGDVVLTTPVIRAVREYYPNSYIAYLGDKRAVTLLEQNPFLNEIIPFDFTRPTILEQPRVMWELRKRSFDVFVDFFSNPRSAMLARSGGAPIRIGKEVAGRGALYTHQIAGDKRLKTATAFHFEYVRPLCVPQTQQAPEIFLTDVEQREAQNYLKWQDVDFTKPIIGLHPGATWPAKMWPWERFADLADVLRAKLGAQIVITQGPDDEELVGKISSRVVGNHLILPLMELRQLAAIISCMSVYIANDNGTMHISAAVGTKTIGIFGPGEEEIWFPYAFGDGHLALRKNVPCHPCHLDFCNREGDNYMACMKLLTVKDVFEEVRKRIK